MVSKKKVIKQIPRKKKVTSKVGRRKDKTKGIGIIGAAPGLKMNV